MRVKKGPKGTGLRTMDISFGKIWEGQSRKVHLTYTIPGGKPRSVNTTRAMRAYASFCAMAHAVDRAKVEVRVPKGFDISVGGASMSSKVRGAERIFTSGPIADPLTWFACVQGTNDGGYTTANLTTTSGRRGPHGVARGPAMG